MNMARALGLFANLLDVDKFVSINRLQSCDNPVYIDRNAPTADGVLSYEIFGSSTFERQNRMAYIDLSPHHYMTPLAAATLNSYDRTLNKILYSQGRYRFEDGKLIEDFVNGESGPDFLYEIWGKVKVKDKETITTKEVQKFFEVPREQLFIDKFPIIPAFYRDLNVSGEGAYIKKSSNVINSQYSSMIAYTKTLRKYTDTFGHMANLTQSRIQSVMVDIYNALMVQQVKGKPSKFGLIRRAMQGKNVNYSARLVISSPILQRSSYRDVMVKFGTAVVPLAYTITCFFPFVVHHMKRFFDQEFLQGGKYPYLDDQKQLRYTTITRSYSENEITDMITHYLNVPADRHNTVLTPEDVQGRRFPMLITGKFGQENTTITRLATITDILYIVAKIATEDKHVFITRYPLDNYNGQWPGRVEISTTVRTTPAIIGNKYYPFFPICEGDPANNFIDTLQFSNTMLGAMNGDYEMTVTLHSPLRERSRKNKSVNASQAVWAQAC